MFTSKWVELQIFQFNLLSLASFQLVSLAAWHCLSHDVHIQSKDSELHNDKSDDIFWKFPSRFWTSYRYHMIYAVWANTRIRKWFNASKVQITKAKYNQTDSLINNAISCNIVIGEGIYVASNVVVQIIGSPVGTDRIGNNQNCSNDHQFRPQYVVHSVTTTLLSCPGPSGRVPVEHNATR